MHFIVGCNEALISDFVDTEVAAIVRGEEITVGDLRFLYSDDSLIDNLDGTIKAKLAEQEVTELNLDVSQELQEIKDRISGKSVNTFDEDDTDYANDIRAFVDAQAKKFGMVPEEYYEMYVEKTQAMVVYVTAYTEEMLDEPMNDGSEYVEKANMILDKLVEDNEGEIQIFLK
jgi:hypothetical protein